MIWMLANALPVIMRADPVTIIIGIVVAGSVAYSYQQARKARKAAAEAKRRTRGHLVQVRQSALPRRWVIGRRRIGAYEMDFGTHGDSNNFLTYVLYWCEGPIDAIETLWFDDKPLRFNAQGEVYEAGYAIDIAVKTSGGITGGIIGAMLRRVYVDQATYNSLAVGSTYQTDYVVRAKAGVVNASEFAGLVRVSHHLGTTSQTVDSLAAANLGYAASKKFLGCAYSVVEIKYDENIFLNGVPNISATIRGANNIYDPRTGTSGWSNNAALGLNHYYRVMRCGPELAASAISQDHLIASANISDELVPSSEGVDLYERRYTFDGVIDSDQDTESIREAFEDAMAGYSIWRGGLWRIVAGHYITPTLELTDDDVMAPLQITTKVARRDRINTVRGLYSSEATRWQPTDFRPYSNDDWIAADGNVLADDLDLSNTASHSACQRLAKIHALRSRQWLRVSGQWGARGLRAICGGNVLLTHERTGWQQRPMEVLDWSWGIKDRRMRIVRQIHPSGPGLVQRRSTPELDRVIPYSTRPSCLSRAPWCWTPLITTPATRRFLRP